MTGRTVGRDVATGRTVALSWRDGRIVESVEKPCDSEADGWIAPAFWDIQTNGRWGRSYSDPTLTIEDVERIVCAQAALGTAKLCPTLITAPLENTAHGLRMIAAACERSPDVARRIVGIHLEGPWISELDGYRGAHPLEAVRDPSWDDFQRLQDASGGRIVLVTLAPERPGAIPFIRSLVESGVVVAIGHTAANAATLSAATESGASLSTHLGNGIASPLPRHPNPIWHQAADDRLFASLIADGHHLDPDTLRVLIRAKGADRLILVSDASPLAGLPVGTYGPWAIDASGKVVVSGTSYLAGSNQPLAVGLQALLREGSLTPAHVLATVTANPARLLGHPAPRLAPNQPADIVGFRVVDGAFLLTDVWIDGRPVDFRAAEHAPADLDEARP